MSQGHLDSDVLKRIIIMLSEEEDGSSKIGWLLM